MARVLLTITTTRRPATDLSFLLHKHPDRVQSFPQAFGTATVFYPEASENRCTAAFLVEVDGVTLARRRSRAVPDFSLSHYVNDRPYAASSLVAVALGRVFSTARSGRCDARQQVADAPMPLQIDIPALPCRGGARFAGRIFEPLGWSVSATPVPLDARFPDWGDSRYVALRIEGELRLADALNQLHVLLPVLDESKHYWQGPDEVDKLIHSGGGWLAGHPEREEIARRYLGRSAWLTRAALARLAELDDASDESLGPDPDDEVAQLPERRVPLNRQRHDAVLATLQRLGAQSVIDLGCGPGAFLVALAGVPGITTIAGVDVSARALALAERRLQTARLPARQLERISLLHGALTYEDARLTGYDAAVLMEVVEHVDPERLPALEHAVFSVARPRAVIVTTPNADYNQHYEGLTGMRHPDHRFEWTRGEFAGWTRSVATSHGYRVELGDVGPTDPQSGAPTQLAVFDRG